MVVHFGKYVLLYKALLMFLTSGTDAVSKIQTASIGDVASLRCRVDLSDLLIVQWSHSLKEIIIHNVLSSRLKKVGKYTSTYLNESNSAVLEFTVNSTEDVGNYQCVVYSHFATKKTNVWLQLDLLQKGEDSNGGEILASMGEAARLEWMWQPFSTPPTVVWQHKRKLVVHHVSRTSEKNVGRYTSRVEGNGTLVVLEISAVDFNDAGIVSSVSYLESGGSEKKSWILQVQGHPHITIEEDQMIENQTMKAACCVDYGLPTMFSEIIWILGGITVRSTASLQNFNDSNETVCSNFTFVIERRYHGTSLDCFVKNDLNASSKGSSFFMNVFYRPSVILLQQHTTRKLFYVGLGTEEVLLTCISNGNPEPVVTLWKKARNGNWTISLDKPKVSSGRAMGAVWNIRIKNEKNVAYRCVAVNAIGSEAVSNSITTDRSTEVANIVFLYTGMLTSFMWAFGFVVWKSGRRMFYEKQHSTDENRYFDVSASVYSVDNDNAMNDTVSLSPISALTDSTQRHNEENVYEHAI